MPPGKINTTTSSTKEFWGDLPAGMKIGIIVIGGIGAFFGIRSVWKAIGQARRDKAVNEIKTTTSSGGTPISVDIGGIANTIYQCFYDNDWFGMSEDEEGAIAALSGCPKSLIPDLKQSYKIISSGHDLKSDFQSYVSSEQYATVSTLLA